MDKHYLNLTNGIEWLPEMQGLGLSYSFIRLETSACERKCWDKVLQQLDADFLMNLALGHNCIVYDASSRKPVSRAQFYGLAMVEYVLNRAWLDREEEVFIRGCFSTHYFERVYRSLNEKTFLKLKYFRKFLAPSLTEIRIPYRCKKSLYDSHYDYYNQMLTGNSTSI